MTFNTGRHYTPEGQVIKAMIVDVIQGDFWEETEYLVHFWDQSRHIWGEITISEFSEREIVSAYDKGGYKSIPQFN